MIQYEFDQLQKRVKRGTPRIVQNLVTIHLRLVALKDAALKAGSTMTLKSYREAIRVNGAAIRCKLDYQKYKRVKW